MKTPLLYGSITAIGGAVLTLLLFFAGLHDAPEKLKTAQTIGSLFGIAITITFLALAMRDKRAQTPADAEWGYGSALGTGVLTGLVGAVLSTLFTYIYFAFINPGFPDTILAAQQAAMEAKGMSSSQIANAEPMMRKLMSPVVQSCFVLVGGFIVSTILALIVAIFFKNPRPATSGAEAPSLG